MDDLDSEFQTGTSLAAARPCQEGTQCQVPDSQRRPAGGLGVYHLPHLQTACVLVGGDPLLIPNWKPHIPGDCRATPRPPTPVQRGPQWHNP
ncbi:paxillin [Homo sapiens]|uniref:Paxillin n=2 Tax=Hominidae TaxID=9604 RepID=F8VZ39_HUMAN|nr:paxillin [Homo sapiens]KAI4068539.1 paxillin [Homo sapiens]PNJ82407.1 PXN isoform 4 [Pongo abelii]